MTGLLFTDSHAHLDRPDYDEDRPAVLERSRQAGVTTVVNIALGPEAAHLERAYEFTLATPGTYLAVGVHPHDVSRMTDETTELLRTYCRKERVVAVGEIGLDYYYEHSPRETQRQRFRELLGLALQENLPVIVHSRDAFDETLPILQESNVLGSRGGVLHCFGGTADEATRYLQLGAYIGFAGIVTFKKAENVREAVRLVPMDRILIETDAPFLAPEPYRGKRNEPAYVVRTAEAVAKIKGISISEVARITRENAARLFRLPAA